MSYILKTISIIKLKWENVARYLKASLWSPAIVRKKTNVAARVCLRKDEMGGAVEQNGPFYILKHIQQCSRTYLHIKKCPENILWVFTY